MNTPVESRNPWEAFLAELDHWIAQHGSLSNLRQKDLGRDGYELGKRVRAIRQEFTRGSLSHEQIQELESRHGWQWSPHQAAWLAQFEGARDFFADCPEGPMPRKVGDWLYQVRRAHAQQRLTQNQLDLLATVPQILHVGAAADLARDITTWLEANPGKTVADINRDDEVRGSRLLRRIIYVRHRYHDGLLDAHDQEELEALPGWRW